MLIRAMLRVMRIKESSAIEPRTMKTSLPIDSIGSWGWTLLSLIRILPASPWDRSSRPGSSVDHT